MTTQILHDTVKDLISENGTTSNRTIEARIAWGPDRLAEWLMHQQRGSESYSDLYNACRYLCLYDFDFDA